MQYINNSQAGCVCWSCDVPKTQNVFNSYDRRKEYILKFY